MIPEQQALHSEPPPWHLLHCYHSLPGPEASQRMTPATMDLSQHPEGRDRPAEEQLQTETPQLLEV